MALIGMAVYATAQNKKDNCLNRTLLYLEKNTDFDRHRLILSINGYTEATKVTLDRYKDIISEVIWNKSNLGTAEAVNKAWKLRTPGEHCVKMDDDIVIHQIGWADRMEEVLQRDQNIGQIGLKRRDCIESPDNNVGFYKSELKTLPHEPGQKWITVEKVNHVMGSCVMHSDLLLNKVGYLYQPGVYGFDDVFMSLRSNLAGFYNTFLVNADIEHIDEGNTPYQKWKEKEVSRTWGSYTKLTQSFNEGKTPLYYNPYE